MDSLTQIALGAAVSVAVMGRRTAAWKAAAWGALAGTLPDLDVLIDHGDPVLDMVLHRAETHALFWLALFSVPLGLLVARLQGPWAQWRRWWLAMALALLTHPLLDALTVYGTQLALPFSNHPYGVGSVFIIDPLVTLPWLAGTLVAMACGGSARGLRANGIGLALGCAYLAWSVVAQQWVLARVQQTIAQQGIPAQRVLVTPAPLNTLLWRAIVITPTEHLEGFHSLLDAPGPVRFDAFDRGAALDARLGSMDRAERIRAFSKGFYKVHRCGTQVCITDLRMGQEPGYVFSFAVAREADNGAANAPLQPLAQVQSVGGRTNARAGLAWLWARMWGQPVPPPR